MAWDGSPDSDYSVVDGVTSATYTDPAGTATTASAVRVRPATVTKSDIVAGASLGVTIDDAGFIVWLSTIDNSADLRARGLLVVGGVSYRVIAVRKRPDGVIAKIMVRTFK